MGCKLKLSPSVTARESKFWEPLKYTGRGEIFCVYSAVIANFEFKLNHFNNRYYFLHSFMVQLKDNKNLSGYYSYKGNKITSLIKKDNIIGCQFHPERSGKDGLNFLKNFLEI